ncbi:MAG: phosphoenolpyruvate synthase [Betaproteobacteria bacterium]|nr:MAG: phosphoenolpyruvate synthase [Betaproteobacteria bacterium]
MAVRTVSTGLASLDAILGGLRIGDNVVWRVEAIDDYRAFVAPFAAGARAAGRRVVYIRFAPRPPVVDAEAVSVVHNLDAFRGFESFTVRLHEIIRHEGPETFYVFDCLSDLLDAWATDAMVGNFFRVTCPYLFELRTVAYFALERDRHSTATVDRVRATTQLLIDLHNEGGTRYVHPLKVWQRSSPTMFLPHRQEGERLTPITVSAEATKLSARRSGRAERRMDAWEALFLRAAALRAARADAPERRAMVEQLCRLLLGRDERILALARRYFTLDDLLDIEERLIGTGFIGGKAVGMLLARAILRADREARWSERLEPHDSFFIGADLFHSYIVDNGWWPLFMWQRSDAGYLPGAAELRELLLHGTFPEPILREFQKMLEHFGQYPIIVRSSSLLEDGFGNAFAGKYDSFFCVNQGSPEERLVQLLDAVKRVYASTLSEEALQYRLQRGLARQEEQMALLVQRVAGAYQGKHFFPPFAGVGLSYNTFVWRHDIDPHAGMLRLVVGLGTRAVDRVEGDYPRIVSLDKPLLQPHGDPEERKRFTQRDADVLDVAQNTALTLPLTELKATPVSLENLLAEGDFPAMMRRMLGTLERAYEYPVDIEFTGTFASDAKLYVNLIQCRPLQTRGIQSRRVEIGAPPEGRTLFSSTGRFMGGSIVQPIARVIAVDPERYTGLSLSDKYEVARIVGRLNRCVKNEPERRTLLMGPGRWGTSTPRLGVPVRFAEINGMAAIAEVAFPAGGLFPELSFGTHFFQDLVESSIFYLALHPGRAGCRIHDELVDRNENLLAQWLPDDAPFARVLRVVDLAQGFRLMADIVSQEVVCCLA